MKTRGLQRIGSIVGAVSLAAVSAVALAEPASAVTRTVDIDCTSSPTIHANVGDTIVINLGPGCNSFWYLTNLNGPHPLPDYTESGFLDFVSTTATVTNSHLSFANDWYAKSNGSGVTTTTTTLRSTDGAGTGLSVGSVVAALWNVGTSTNLLIYYGGAGSTPDASASPATLPPPWFQSTGRAAAETTCPNNWSPSWAWWPNHGTGGFVCNRELHYDGSSGTWLSR